MSIRTTIFLFCCLLSLPARGQALLRINDLLTQASQLSQTGQPIEAEPLAREALSQIEALTMPQARMRSFKLAHAQQQLGIALRLQGRAAEAEPLLRAALPTLEQIKGAGSRIAVKTRTHLGMALLAQGRYAEADRELRGAMRLAPEPQDSDTLEMWLETRVRLARLQTLSGNHTEAEQLLQTVLEKSESDKNTDVQRRRQSALGDFALLRMRQGRLSEAEAHARASTELAAPAWGETHKVTAEAYDQLGQILLRRGRDDEAAIWLRRAVDIAESLIGQDMGASAKAYRNLALLLEKRAAHDEAETLFTRATTAAEAGGSNEMLAHTLRAQARFLMNRGRPDAAQPLYDRAVKLADQLFALSRGLDDAARDNMMAGLRPLYNEAIANRVRQDAKEPGRGHDRAALMDVSRTQSRLFTEMLRAADVARLAGNSNFITLKAQRDEALQRQLELRRRFTLSARLDAAGQMMPIKVIDDPLVLARWRTAASNLQERIASARQRREDIEAHLWRDFPRFMELEDPRPVSVDDLQRRWLRPDETLLVYHRLPQLLLIFLVSRDDFQLVRVRTDQAELDRLIAEARKPMEAGGRLDRLAQLDPDVLHRLYALLLQPLERRLPAGRRLLVVGDGPLFTLPYEMLVTRWNEADRAAFAQARAPDLGQYAGLAYAGMRWRFTYQPSLAALAIKRDERPARAAFNESLIAYADPIFERGEEIPAVATRNLLTSLGANRGGMLPRLPETADEVTAVATILGGQNTIHLREAAQEYRVKHDELSRTRYLHFATHGLLSGEFSMLQDYAMDDTAVTSRGLKLIEDADMRVKDGKVQTATRGEPALALTLVGDLQGEDGLLTMSEVMDLKLDADLVVLSACNTAGLGTPSGEGFAGLTRAFMHAGARGLLVSQWSVESLATRDLITDVYRRLKAGDAGDDALSAAQEKLRNSRDSRLKLSRAHPYFWAPFVRVGE